MDRALAKKVTVHRPKYLKAPAYLRLVIGEYLGHSLYRMNTRVQKFNDGSLRGKYDHNGYVNFPQGDENLYWIDDLMARGYSDHGRKAVSKLQVVCLICEMFLGDLAAGTVDPITLKKISKSAKALSTGGR